MKKSRLTIRPLPEGGYTLVSKDARFNRIFLSCLLFLGLLFFTFLLIVFRENNDAATPLLFMEVFSVAGAVLGGIILFSEDPPSVPWRIDDQGITLLRRWRKPVTMTWADIKDWGFSYWGYVRYHGEAFRFYFSPTRMKATNDAKAKVFPRQFQGFILVVYPPDAIALRRSGLLDYCQNRLGGDDSDIQRYVPLFVSNIMEASRQNEN